MSIKKLLLYSRKDCCLCEEMKATLREVAVKVPLELEEIDIDSSADLRRRFDAEVPVLFIDGRKAFKYRITAKDLERRLHRSAFWRRLGGRKRGG